MFEKLLVQCNGRELIAKSDLSPTEIGVEVNAGDVLGLYAFPERYAASNFMDYAKEEIFTGPDRSLNSQAEISLFSNSQKE